MMISSNEIEPRVDSVSTRSNFAKAAIPTLSMGDLSAKKNIHTNTIA